MEDYLTNLSRKLHENEEILAGGLRVPGVHPPYPPISPPKELARNIRLVFEDILVRKPLHRQGYCGRHAFEWKAFLLWSIFPITSKSTFRLAAIGILTYFKINMLLTTNPAVHESLDYSLQICCRKRVRRNRTIPNVSILLQRTANSDPWFNRNRSWNSYQWFCGEWALASLLAYYLTICSHKLHEIPEILPQRGANPCAPLHPPQIRQGLGQVLGGDVLPYSHYTTF